MKVTIIDKDLEELIEDGGNNGKYKKISKDKRFVAKLIDIYNLMNNVKDTNELSTYSYLHYEKLKKIGQSSVRIMNNRVERLLFTETENGLEITLIELNDTHYGKKR